MGIPTTIQVSTAQQAGTNIKNTRSMAILKVSVITRKKTHQFEALHSSPCTTQSFVEDWPCDSEHFFICQIQNAQAIAFCRRTRKGLYSDLPVTIQAHHKELTYLWCRLYTTADVNVMPGSIYKVLYFNYSSDKYRLILHCESEVCQWKYLTIWKGICWHWAWITCSFLSHTRKLGACSCKESN